MTVGTTDTAEQVEALTVREFCYRYGVGKTYLYSEISAGRIRARHAGRRTLIAAADAAAWFASLPEHIADKNTTHRR